MNGEYQYCQNCGTFLGNREVFCADCVRHFQTWLKNEGIIDEVA